MELCRHFVTKSHKSVTKDGTNIVRKVCFKCGWTWTQRDVKGQASLRDF